MVIKKSKKTNNQKVKKKSNDGLANSKLVLIVCEGQTEKGYLKDFVISNDMTFVHIEQTKGTDSKSVINTTLKYVKNSNSSYSDVYCVIDRDTHASFDEALELANKHNFRIIASYPCFEYWLLCHFEYTRSDMRAKDCINQLNTYWVKNFKTSYTKTNSNIYNKIRLLQDTAHSNALKARKDYMRDNGIRNPSTDVDLLLNELKAISIDFEKVRNLE